MGSSVGNIIVEEDVHFFIGNTQHVADHPLHLGISPICGSAQHLDKEVFKANVVGIGPEWTGDILVVGDVPFVDFKARKISRLGRRRVINVVKNQFFTQVLPGFFFEALCKNARSQQKQCGYDKKLFFHASSVLVWGDAYFRRP